MKKLLYLFVSGLILASCSVDQPETSESNADLAYDASTLDASSLGNYKGVFTTNNSDYRATVEIDVPYFNSENTTKQKSYPTALVSLQNGKSFVATANRNISLGEEITKLEFSGSEMSFKFSVNDDGTSPIITDVNYKNLKGDILVAKNTSFAPVTTFTGTYQCFQCGNSEPRTWNVVISGDATGDQTYATQVEFNGNTYSGGQGLQENCVVDGTNSDITFCTSRSGDAGSNVGFMVGSNAVEWEGQMGYSNSAPDCSSQVGFWYFKRGLEGQKSGTFKTDAMNPESPNCFTRLAFENFEDDTLMYTTSEPEFTSGNDDYFTRTDGSNIGASFNNFSNLIGNGYFAAQDVDSQIGIPAYIMFENINIASFSTVYVDASFAEDDASNNDEDWDNTDNVIMEYSFDGTNWTPILAITNDGSQFNSAPQIDTDFDGVGDGVIITETFQDFRVAFNNNVANNPTASGTVAIRIAINLNAGDEDIAIDNILIRGY
ncbi:hypothetical protein [Cochleicola gelatinilyticus]|uniref:DUF5689 domain-containing protein n=1 Tax=Cochleicola gelatinilyticus TaxID=1763537 RepID=A0A167G7H4_9FLAO|nr:hypothetical protein [Cochleicola gelatinilyticus]OAB77298.1 hypothetical protein ULVI_12400 [Cochleicola gelatinilyticus]